MKHSHGKSPTWEGRLVECSPAPSGSVAFSLSDNDDDIETAGFLLPKRSHEQARACIQVNELSVVVGAVQNFKDLIMAPSAAPHASHDEHDLGMFGRRLMSTQEDLAIERSPRSSRDSPSSSPSSSRDSPTASLDTQGA